MNFNKRYIVLVLFPLLFISVLFLNLEIIENKLITENQNLNSTLLPSINNSSKILHQNSTFSKGIDLNITSSEKNSTGDNSSKEVKIDEIDEKDTPNFKIPLICNEMDILYTWVNGSDPHHIKKRKLRGENETEFSASELVQRVRDLDGLKYSLRSIEKYAPFVRKIWILTDNQIPTWFGKMYFNNIQIIFHESVFHNKSDLPTFNSNAIESKFTFLPEGISDCFLYLNDDIFFGNNVTSETFYNSNEKSIAIFPEPWTAPMIGGTTIWHKSITYSNEILDRVWNERMSRNLPSHGGQFYHKKVFQKMYKQIGKELDATGSHPFRTGLDTQIPFLFQQYALRYFRVFVPEKISRFASVNDNYIELEEVYRGLLQEKPKQICLNDDMSLNPPKQSLIDLSNFYNTYFPNKVTPEIIQYIKRIILISKQWNNEIIPKLLPTKLVINIGQPFQQRVSFITWFEKYKVPVNIRWNIKHRYYVGSINHELKEYQYFLDSIDTLMLDGIGNVNDEICTMKNVIDFNLVDSYINFGFLHSSPLLVEWFHSLKKFRLSIGSSVKDLEMLMKTLQRSSNLKELFITGPENSVVDNYDMIKDIPSIESLAISFSKFYSKDFIKIISHPNLKNLVIHKVEFIDHPTTTRNMILEHLKTNKNLLKIHITGSNIGSVDIVDSLVDFINTNTTCTDFQIFRTPSKLEALKIDITNSTIKKIFINDNNVLEQLQNNWNNSALESIQTTCFDSIANQFSINFSKVTNLDILSFNSDDSILKLVQMNIPSITTLKITKMNNLQFVKALQLNNHITTLELSSCGDRDMLLKILKLNHLTLHSITLNNYTDIQILNLKESIINYKNLQSLSISCSSQQLINGDEYNAIMDILEHSSLGYLSLRPFITEGNLENGQLDRLKRVLTKCNEKIHYFSFFQQYILFKDILINFGVL
ncbi:hypothetical protein DLAC_04036 [Tieghemostelium lacteum]|uniref:Glycophosphotransferase n=1 Tax=Tieghemostelium lacteum TaxID=361077 RepID=A0A151ZS26_TIELA|nr:hypothetical protein DLAC_04036 [Tieghemostelium lacteum]|eukprot:KYQ96738.1 hypothetical protein DLAC_04036 [Tieghemostelium lacteum]